MLLNEFVQILVGVIVPSLQPKHDNLTYMYAAIH